MSQPSMLTLNSNAYRKNFPTHIKLVDKDAHTPPVERSNRTVKERVRYLMKSLPFSCTLSLIIEAMLDDYIQNLNRLPRKLVFLNISVLLPLLLVLLSLILQNLSYLSASTPKHMNKIAIKLAVQFLGAHPSSL